MKSDIVINDTIYSSPFVSEVCCKGSTNALAELGALVLMIIELKKNGVIFKEKVHLMSKFFPNSEEIFNTLLSNSARFSRNKEGDFLPVSQDIFNLFCSREFALRREKMSKGGKKGMKARYKAKPEAEVLTDCSGNDTLETPYNHLRNTLDTPYKVSSECKNKTPVTAIFTEHNSDCDSEVCKNVYFEKDSVQDKIDNIYISNNIDNNSNKEYNKDYNTIKLKNGKQSLKPKKQQRFLAPTLEELKSYIHEIGSSISAEAFLDYYESVDWYIGNKKMSSWKAAVRTWQRKQSEQPKTPNLNGKQQQSYNSSDRVGRTKDKDYSLPF